MKLQIIKGATSKTILVFVQDSTSTTGAGKTGLVFNTASLVCYYARPLEAAVSVTLATQTVTGAYSSGGFVEVSSANMPGLYRLDVPDAALASGVDSVVLMLKGASGMAPLPLEIQLTGVDLNNATSAGIARLDAAVTTRAVAGDAMDLVADAVDGAALAASAVTEIQSGLALSTQVDALEADTTTLLGRLTTGRATNLDNLDAAITTRAAPGDAMDLVADAVDGAAVAASAVSEIQSGLALATQVDALEGDTTTLLGRLTSGRATNLDNLDAAITTRAAPGDAMNLAVDAVSATALAASAVTEIQTGLALSSQVDALEADTTTLLARLTSGRATNLDSLDATVSSRLATAGYTAPPTEAVIADKILGRSLAGAADGGRTVQDALRALRNRQAIAAGVYTVYQEDDTTSAWTGVATTAVGNPIVEINPA